MTSCVGSYTGTRCEKDPCYGEVCSYNGKCTVTADHLKRCLCHKGYSGSKCQLNQPICDVTTHCGINAASCQIEGSAVQCFCKPGIWQNWF